AQQSHQVGPEIDEDRQQRPQVQHRRHEQRRLGHVHAQRGEEGRDQHEMARRRDRQELGQALDETPDDGGCHGTARYSERAPTPTTSRPSATAAAASANASAGTAIVPCESPNASSEPRATTKAGISSGAASPRRTMPTAGVPGGAWSGTGASMSSHPSGTAVSARSDGTSGSPARKSVAATFPSRPT